MWNPETLFMHSAILEVGEVLVESSKPTIMGSVDLIETLRDLYPRVGKFLIIWRALRKVISTARSFL